MTRLLYQYIHKSVGSLIILLPENDFALVQVCQSCQHLLHDNGSFRSGQDAPLAQVLQVREAQFHREVDEAQVFVVNPPQIGHYVLMRIIPQQLLLPPYLLVT